MTSNRPVDSRGSKKYTDLVKFIDSMLAGCGLARGSSRIANPAPGMRMPLFSAKLDYALRAAVDLALQPADTACQSREIAARQNIRGPYLDQILAVMKREGIVRSIRGAGGGYTLARSPHRITVGEVVRAVVGDQLLVGGGGPTPDPARTGAAYIVRRYELEVEALLNSALDKCTLEDLASRKQTMDDSLSIMPSI